MVERQDNTVQRRMSREGDLILSLLRSSDYGDMGGLVARQACYSSRGHRRTHAWTPTDSAVKCRSEWNACLSNPLFWVGLSHPGLRLAPALYSFLRGSVPNPPAFGQYRGGWLSFYTKTYSAETLIKTSEMTSISCISYHILCRLILAYQGWGNSFSVYVLWWKFGLPERGRSEQSL